MTEYVLGFAFDEVRKNVVLIQKVRPAWQAGCYNGVGGHMEGEESPSSAMRREFLEETSVDIPQKLWEPFGTLVGRTYRVHLFKAFTEHVHDVISNTDEPVLLASLEDLSALARIGNLTYLIPLALDRQMLGRPSFEYV